MTANGLSAGSCPNDVRGCGFEQRSQSQTLHARTNAETSPRMRGHQKRCIIRRSVDSKPWCAGRWRERTTFSRNKGGTTMQDEWRPSLTWRNRPLYTTRVFQTSRYCCSGRLSSISSASGLQTASIQRIPLAIVGSARCSLSQGSVVQGDRRLRRGTQTRSCRSRAQAARLDRRRDL